jgi:hypothetical protein
MDCESFSLSSCRANDCLVEINNCVSHCGSRYREEYDEGICVLIECNEYDLDDCVSNDCLIEDNNCVLTCSDDHKKDSTYFTCVPFDCVDFLSEEICDSHSGCYFHNNSCYSQTSLMDNISVGGLNGLDVNYCGLNITIPCKSRFLFIYLCFCLYSFFFILIFSP